jgi:signal transduction histidine kinase
MPNDFAPSPESWSTQQLAEFLAVVSSYEDEQSAIQVALERTAEALESEVAALIRGSSVEASIGFPVGAVNETGLLAVREGRSDSIDVAGLGSCAAICLPLGDTRSRHLVVARFGSDGFNQEERDLLRGMSRVLALTLRMLRGLVQERTLRKRSEREMAKRKRIQEEADQLRQEFFASVSHELRTPLTSIIGYTELLLAGVAGELTERQQTFLEVTQRNARRELRLVNDLLFVSRMGTDEFAIEQGEADLSLLVKDCVDATRPAAEKKGIELSHFLTDGPICTGDSDRLAQLLDNLVSNAIKFTPVGGRVEVRLSTDDDRLLLDVINTGSFIPSDERDRIFDRFYRAQSTAKQVVPGIGLGLAISKAIVDAHHGEIRVLSAEDAGTTFRVMLPANAELPEPAGARAAQAAASR